jgi:hypothetical protein
MKIGVRTAAFAGVALLSAAASAQEYPVLENASFEEVNVVDSEYPRGWNRFNSARYRSVGDGLTPPLTAAHSGTACVDETVISVGPSDFVGWSSDALVDPKDVFSRRNNPGYIFDPPDGEDLTVSGWFMIPAADPIVRHRAGIKLEFRRTVNNSVYEGFEWLDIDPANPTLVDGLVLVQTATGPGVHTNGKWVFMERVFEQSRFGDWPKPPENPNARVSILPLRFGQPFAAGARGTIFWDDIGFSRGDSCPADFDGDGFVTGIDYDLYVAAFEAGEMSADFDGDGFITGIDFDLYVSAFEAGCA